MIHDSPQLQAGKGGAILTCPVRYCSERIPGEDAIALITALDQTRYVPFEPRTGLLVRKNGTPISASSRGIHIHGWDRHDRPRGQRLRMGRCVARTLTRLACRQDGPWTGLRMNVRDLAAEGGAKMVRGCEYRDHVVDGYSLTPARSLIHPVAPG